MPGWKVGNLPLLGMRNDEQEKGNNNSYYTKMLEL